MSEIRIFEVEGRFKMGDNRKQKFRMYIRALKEEHALEKIYSLLGGNHHCPRYMIKIEKIREITKEELEKNPNILKLVK